MSEDLVYHFGRIDAVRYGDIHGEWDEGAATRIAQFVIGQTVSSHITPLNETLLRVVQPVDDFWDPKHGLADINIVDPKSGRNIALALGQWMARYPSGQLRPLAHNVVVASHLPPPPSESFEAELRKVLAKHERHKGSETPDNVLADFLNGVLSNYNTAIRKRAVALNESASA